MNIHYIDYCRNNKQREYPTDYLTCRNARAKSFKRSGLDTITQYTYTENGKDLPGKNIYENNMLLKYRSWFDKHMHGYYIWKPLIILDKLNSVKDNDIVVFWDCNPLYPNFNFNYREHITRLMQGRDIHPGPEIPFHHREWTHSKCFTEMGCTGEEYTGSTVAQRQVAWSIWKCNDKTKTFVKAWYEWCINPIAVQHDIDGQFNKPYFKQHRWEQSIFTNLCIKHKLTGVELPKRLLFSRENFRRQYSTTWKNLEHLLLTAT